MEDTIYTLEEKIRCIRLGDEYKRLITKHRGPLDEGRLRELNMRINAFESQKRMLLPVSKIPSKGTISAVAAPNISRNNVIKAKPYNREVEEPGEDSELEEELEDEEPEKELEKEPVPELVPRRVNGLTKRAILEPTIKSIAPTSRAVATSKPVIVSKLPAPKISNAVRRGMAPSGAPVPVVKTAGKYSTVDKNGKPSSKGATKAAQVGTRRTASLSKPPSSFIKPVVKPIINPKVNIDNVEYDHELYDDYDDIEIEEDAYSDIDEEYSEEL